VKTGVKIILGLIVLFALLMTATGLAAQFMLSSSRIDQALSSVDSELPVEITASGGEFDLMAWFRFRPAVAIHDLRVGNPPGYSAEPMITAQEVSAEIALLSVFGDELDIRRFTLEEPVLRVEQDGGGRTNLQVLLAAVSSKKEAPDKPQEPSGESRQGRSVAIDGFFLRSGTVQYIRPDQDPLTVSNIDLSLTDFAPDRASDVTLSADLFGAGSSQLDFEGRVGPFQSQGLPAHGKLSCDLAPNDVPERLRREYFGELLSGPGQDSRVQLDASMEGDLFAAFEGDGKLTFTDVMLGEAPEKRMPLRGETPLKLRAERVLANPSFSVEIEDASLRLGEGQWQGQAQLAYTGSQFEGGSKGSITGVEINELIQAFATPRELLFGIGELPGYEIRFQGSNAQEIRNSLQGDGKLTLDKGRIAFLDFINSLNQHARRLSGAAPEAAKGTTEFARLSSGLQVRNQRLEFTNLVLESGAAAIAGNGYVGFNRDLDFDLQVEVTGELAQRLGGAVPGLKDPSRLNIPVKVGGTTDSPRITPDIKRAAKGQLQERVTGLLDSLFGGNKQQDEEQTGDTETQPTAPPAPEETEPTAPPLPEF